MYQHAANGVFLEDVGMRQMTLLATDLHGGHLNLRFAQIRADHRELGREHSAQLIHVLLALPEGSIEVNHGNVPKPERREVLSIR